MKRIKTDYTGWALCCIAREIDRAWVTPRSASARGWLRRLHNFEDMTPILRYYFYPSDCIQKFIEYTKHAHWPGKAAMIRELQRRLDEYNQSQREEQYNVPA